MPYKVTLKKSLKTIAVLEVTCEWSDINNEAMDEIMFAFETKFNDPRLGVSTPEQAEFIRAHIERIP